MLAMAIPEGDVEAILAYADQENGLWQQAHRLLADNRSFSFSGEAENDEAKINYAGTKQGPYIYGGYTLTYSPTEAYNGSFAGSVTRFGRSTGAYISANGERGVFTGKFSDSLNTILSGGFSCTANCPSGNE